MKIQKKSTLFLYGLILLAVLITVPLIYRTLNIFVFDKSCTSDIAYICECDGKVYTNDWQYKSGLRGSWCDGRIIARYCFIDESIPYVTQWLHCTHIKEFQFSD